MKASFPAAAAFALPLVVAACAARAPVAPHESACPATSTAAPAETPELGARRSLLQREASIAMSEGAGPLTVVAADMAAEGDRVGAFTALPAEGCLLVYARGSESVDDLDLLAFADDGTPIGSDEATDPHPAMMLCAPLPVRGYVVARVAQGRGLVAVGVHVVPPEAAFRVGRGLNARGRPGEPPKENEVWPGLDAKATLLRRELGARWEELRRVAVPVDSRTPGRVTLPIEAGRCLAFLATPSEETSELDVQLESEGGRVFARAQDAGRDRTALVCSSVPSNVTIDVRPRVGSGLVAVVVARAMPGSEPDLLARAERIDLFPTRDLAAVRAAHGARLGAAGYGAATARAEGSALVGRRATVPIAVKDGCTRLDVLGGTPLAGLVVDTWSDAGAQTGHGENGSAVTLFNCGSAGKARIDVEAAARPGAFAIEARTEPKADPRLARAGLAGGRLLTRIAAGGDVVRAETLTVLDPVRIAAGQIKSVDLKIPEGRCLDVAAALGEGATGVDLRIVDGSTGAELDLARAALATIAHACAESTARPIRVELRTSTGAADVIVATRATTR